jgi:hypothetical protein
LPAQGPSAVQLTKLTLPGKRYAVVPQVIWIVEFVGKVYLLTNERLNLHNFATFSEDFDLFYRLVGVDLFVLRYENKIIIMDR